ncbi:MAG: ATP-binding cassette domain-containing protein [Oligoflexia bacterium]|nr:ATP-binding cassette domain-containing protein [Oligoflexia bacterium]
MPYIEISDLVFNYPQQQSKSKKIVINERVEIEENQFVIIKGKSGSGKSTLLSTLKGIIPEYISCSVEGKIVIDGIDILATSASASADASGSAATELDYLRKKIVYIFQNPYTQLVCPYVREDLAFSMENLGFSFEEMSVNFKKFAHLFELMELLDRKTFNLSGGECQKMILSSALMANPKILLLDEPTAFLDTNARKNFYQYMQKIKSLRQYTILMVDHNILECEFLADKFIYTSDNESDNDSDNEQVLPNMMELEQVKGTSYTSYTLEVKNLSFGFGNSSKRSLQSSSLLEGINFCVSGNKIVSILGENGSGKSTVLKIISGILKVASRSGGSGSGHGEVVIFKDQERVLDKDYYKRIGIIFQNPETHFLFDTIEEEIFHEYKMGDKRDSVQIPMKMVELFFGDDFDLKRSPYLLSEGEKRRLTLLQTILSGKDILLYDEPSFGQDQFNRELIIKLFFMMKKLNKMQIIVTHDRRLAEQVSDHIYVLEEKKLREINRD